LLPRGNTLLSAATGRYYGTPEYLAPEQAHGLVLNGQADIYALGVIFYEALTGRPPFRGATPRLIVAQHISAPPPPFEDQLPGLDEAVESIIMQALAKDPARRPPTAGALIAALEATGAGGGATRAFASAEIPGTTLLIQEVASSSATPISTIPPDELVTRHLEELAQLRASYEARLDEAAERAQAREQALLDQLTALRAECATLMAQAEATTAIVRERDALLKRVRKLEHLARTTNAASVPTGGRLVLTDAQRAGRAEGTSFPFVPDAVLGRHPDCAIPLADDFISGHHARLAWEAGAWWLVDLGTLNGTLVNGERIERPTQLRNGDVVRLGRVQARVDLDPPGAGDPDRAKERNR
jgi:hypothetical protein